MILNALLYFANKGSLKTFFSSCKSHNQCKPPEATELKKKPIVKLCFLHMPELHKLILHLDQKAAKCKACKWLYGKFQLLKVHQLQENHFSSGKWVKFFGEAWKGAGGEVGSLERVSLILIYIFNEFIYLYSF